MSTQNEQVKALTRTILSRSATDLEFRQQLLTNPRSAIEAYAGTELPETFNLTFTEQDGIGGVRLPEYAGPDAEIAESELETVSGGVTAGYFLVAALIEAAAWYEEDSQCK
jgi:hypothetical protein